ncbi:hypothetical protein [Streptomyces erythrochromogenes]|uniref:hypothetical protein n=1 Tax=Streptomyces erythrochromogenes TaxID=285574 RepID=UPI0004CDBE53|nr:hypothetical protein [Streptomyces erythrochromogenes]
MSSAARASSSWVSAARTSAAGTTVGCADPGEVVDQQRRRLPSAAPLAQLGRLIGGQIPDDVTDTIERLRVQLAALAAVEAAARVEKLGAARLQHAVTTAIRNGASWTAIGNATGTTRQAAHQRFSKVPF